MAATNTQKPQSSANAFSSIAGKLRHVPRKTNYRVSFSEVNDGDQQFYKYWARGLAYGAFFVSLAFAAILFRPSNWVIILHPTSPTFIENAIMLVCLMVLQLFVIISTSSATHATLNAKNPVPVFPPKGLRVALCTTRAPGEPVSMVETTLRAAKKVTYSKGSVDVWLLDETEDIELQLLCRSMNVGYFSRANVASWNQVKPATHRLRQMGTWMLDLFSTSVERPTSKPAYNPRFAAKTKHGNYNAWLAQIAQSGIHYDILAGVDTDQVPLKMFLNRLLGYFNDPDVAFAVGPQVYGNGVQGLAGLVVRWAESQASFFQSTIQRAGNASSSAMFVGTNYAVRMDALKQIGGFYPCITEDMATGLAIHASRNPKTGNRWRSVYTPDVLAIGEGPAFWGPYFTQQWRWAAGSFDTWKKLVWKSIYKLSPRATFHYLLVLLFYPVAACTWLLAIVSSALYLTTGATAVDAPWGQFVSLYLMAVVLQISLYFWNRRYNVSPHETAGSYGVAGMALTSLVAPIYFSALLGVIFGRKTSFVVTTKGSAVNPDHLGTFKSHILWAGIGAGLGAFGIMHGRHHPALLIWTGMLLIICLMPLVLGMIQIIHDRPVVLPRPQLLGSGETTNA